MASKKTTAKKTKTPEATVDDQQLLADAELAATATPDQLSEITSQAKLLLQYTQEETRALEKAEELKKAIRNLSESVLPALMDGAGVKLLNLDDGTELKRDEAVFASVSKANAPYASAWLENKGYGSLIKYSISIPIDKGDSKLAKKVMALLTKAKIGYTESTGIHPQTLLAFVKESLQEGRELPASITHHTQPVVKVKVKKQG